MAAVDIQVEKYIQDVRHLLWQPAPSLADLDAIDVELPICINSLARPRRGLSPDGDGSAAPAVERLSTDGAGPPTAKRLRADANGRQEGSPAAEQLSRTDAAERWGRSQAAKGRSQRGRRNPTKQSSFDQHSRLCVAIEQLSNWRSALGRINALERWLDPTEAGAAHWPSADAAGPLPPNGCAPLPTSGRKVGSTPSSAGWTPPKRGPLTGRAPMPPAPYRQTAARRRQRAAGWSDQRPRALVGRRRSGAGRRRLTTDPFQEGP